jgi:hypothetical protein
VTDPLTTPREWAATVQHPGEPAHKRIQREHGETPPKSDSEALAYIARVFPGVRVIGPIEPR